MKGLMTVREAGRKGAEVRIDRLQQGRGPQRALSLTITAYPDQVRYLRRKAKSRKQSVSALVRCMVDVCIDADDQARAAAKQGTARRSENPTG